MDVSQVIVYVLVTCGMQTGLNGNACLVAVK